MSKLNGKFVMIAGMIGGLAGTACNVPAAPTGVPTAGPVDGNYVIASHTCNGSPMSMQLPGGQTEDPAQVPTTWSFAGTAGAVAQTLSDGCVITAPALYTFPSSGTMTVSLPGPGTCSTACSGAECTAGQKDPGGPYVAAYSLGGSTLTLTLSGTRCAHDSAGDVEQFVLQKQ
jgi:hypothetical protein